MTTVMVSSVIANKPNNGGNAWVVLSWLLGLKRLGCRVLLVEDISREACADRHGNPAPFLQSENLAYFRAVAERYVAPDVAVLMCDGGDETWGLSYGTLRELAAETDLLVNISGHLARPELLERIKQKAFVDLDPGFTQFWHADGSDAARLKGHDCFYTVGENVGAEGCDIPGCSVDWRPIRQPSLLSEWPFMKPARDDAPFTTVGSWRGAYGGLSVGDKTYGAKVHEFRKFMQLPRLSEEGFEIALEIYPGDHADQERLEDHGWRLTDPRRAAGDPASFRSYVQESKAEFSAAQGVYVDTHSGWFSDRTVRYLSSGRPALVQDTGFSRNLPTGEGLLAFRTLEEAAAGAASIAHDYDRHCEAARQIAEDYFDSDRVLERLLSDVPCAC